MSRITGVTMTYRQSLILIGLATDARDLKAANGWYGDPRQGDSTVDEDDVALAQLHELSEEVMDAETDQRREERERMLGGFVNMMAEVTVQRPTESAEIAEAFYAAASHDELGTMKVQFDKLHLIAQVKETEDRQRRAEKP